MSRVLVNNLNVRAGPSLTAEKIAVYNAGDVIHSGEEIIHNEEGYWLRYTGSSGNKRFVMVEDKDGSKYVEVPPIIPGSRHICGVGCGCGGGRGMTGILGIPKQSQFPDQRIQKWGCCFLCTCVKGGLTTFDQCMDCFNWGMGTGKLRASDCYINVNKEQWAPQIAQRYGTQYHPEYQFQKNSHHFWLTCNGREIYNPLGIGWRG